MATSPIERADSAEARFQLGDRSFDHYARLVQRLAHVPVALVSLLEAERQIIPGAAGLAEPWLSTRQTPLSHSFCQYVVGGQEPLVIRDARTEDWLTGHLGVLEMGVVAYAGWPLVDEAGSVLGSVCAVDHLPRIWTAEEQAALADLAQACSAELQQSLRITRDTEVLLRNMLASVDAAMLFYGAEGQLLMSNGPARELGSAAGFRLDTPPHAGPHVRYGDNRTPIPYDAQIVPLALRGELPPREMEWIGPPGRERALVASSRHVTRHDGRLWGTLITAHDVTDLAHSLQVKEEFIATVSHELRTPLTSIIGNLELLTDELDASDAVVEQCLSRMQRGAANLAARVQELLDADSRQRGDIEIAAVDLTTLARRVCATFAEEAGRAGISLAVAASGAHPADVDGRRIEQALENLVSNALKYSGHGGSITISIATSGETATIAVVDTGVGMTTTELTQAFDIFWRSAAARTSAVPGFGIGLTLVRDVAEEHSGTVEVSSVPGEGTTVRLELPVALPVQLPVQLPDQLPVEVPARMPTGAVAPLSGGAEPAGDEDGAQFVAVETPQPSD